MKHLDRLTGLLRPLETTSQLIHGDLTGNVLFAEDAPPAVIDVAPYWRPPAFASAIVVADALLGEGADEALISSMEHVDDFEQFLARALIYRTVTDAVARPGSPWRRDSEDPYLRPVELVESWCPRAR